MLPYIITNLFIYSAIVTQSIIIAVVVITISQRPMSCLLERENALVFLLNDMNDYDLLNLLKIIF